MNQCAFSHPPDKWRSGLPLGRPVRHRYQRQKWPDQQADDLIAVQHAPDAEATNARIAQAQG